MSLTTLKRYLTGPVDEVSSRKVVSTILAGIADFVISADEHESDEFRREVLALRESIEEESGADQLFIAAGAVVHVLETYQGRTMRGIRKQATELQKMIDMLAQTVINISGASDRSAAALNQIKDDLERSSAIEDVKLLKLRLSDCLAKVRDEVSEQRDETQAVIVSLQKTIAEARDRAGAPTPANIDPLTGLPDKIEAQSAFHDALRSSGRKYIVIVVVNRLQLINARFGSTVGNEVLRFAGRCIEERIIESTDRLFRWSGPSFIALMPRQDTIDHLRSNLKRVLDQRLEPSFDVGGRNALIPISFAWSVIGLIPSLQVPGLIDRFVAAQVPLDYV